VTVGVAKTGNQTAKHKKQLKLSVLVWELLFNGDGRVLTNGCWIPAHLLVHYMNHHFKFGNDMIFMNQTLHIQECTLLLSPWHDMHA
jgi:hypothetical protein